MIGAEATWTAEERGQVLAEVREWLWLYLGSGFVGPEGARASAAQLLDLPAGDLTRLCALHFVLSPAVADVLEHAAPAALRDGARSVVLHEHHRGALRGRPDWPGTTRRRAAAGGDESHYVYTSPRRGRWHAVELATLLAAIADATEVALGSGRPDPTQSAEREEGGSWRVTCIAIGRHAAHLLAQPRLASLLPRLSTQPPGAEERDRLPPPRWWPAVATARDLLRRLVVEGDRAALIEVLHERVVEPANPDRLFELWATLATLVALEGSGWRRQTVRLLGTGGGRPLARYTLNREGTVPTRISIHAQHTPAAWRRASRYAAIFTAYGLAGGMRRPDLILEVSRGTAKRWLLVEVKRTVEPAYIAESIYKVLGYLADFAPVVAGTPEPHAILLVWSLGSQAPVHPTGAGPLVVASPATFGRHLTAILNR